MNKVVLSIRDFLKLMQICISRFVLRIFFVVPVKENRIFFRSYFFKQYACNPKYISEYLEKNRAGKYEIIWAFCHIDNQKELKTHKDVKIIKAFSLKRFYYEATCQIKISNGGYSLIPRRKGQFFVETWHGGCCYKKGGNMLKSNIFVRWKEKITYAEINCFLSSCRTFTTMVARESMGYRGKVLECGMPRNDIFWDKESNRIKEKIREKYKIRRDELMVLFAPTWREKGMKTPPLPDMPVLQQLLEKRFQKKCVVCYRAHRFDKEYKNVHILDVSDYSDMQELLVASDILITDYSSSIWDFSFTYKPCFLYVPDLEQYDMVRGFYFPLPEWGFPYARNMEELGKVILMFDENIYKNNMKQHHELNGSFENGNAAERFVKWMEEEK